MAWETVKHSCGHSERYQMFGPRRDRERRQYTMGQEICPACLKARRKAEAALAAEAAQSAGLPVLQGSAKQVVWAERVRARALKDLDLLESMLRPDNPLVDHARQIIDAERRRNQASAWIESRHVTYDQHWLIARARALGLIPPAKKEVVS